MGIAIIMDTGRYARRQLPNMKSEVVWLCSHRHFHGSPREEGRTLDDEVK